MSPVPFRSQGLLQKNSDEQCAPLISAGEIHVPGINSDLSLSEDQSAFILMLSSISASWTQRSGTGYGRCRVNKADCTLREAEAAMHSDVESSEEMGCGGRI